MFDWSDDKSLTDCKVLKCSAPSEPAKILAALAIFVAAITSPSALIITALFSLSASACLAIVLFISSGKITSFKSILSTPIPHGSDALSTISLILFDTSSRLLNSSSKSTSPTAFLIVVCANCDTACRKFSTSITALAASITL